MAYTVFTDGCSNLPVKILQTLNIRVLPCSYTMDGTPGVYEGDIDNFDAHSYYEQLRNGSVMTTSLLNTQLFLDYFRQELEKGKDILYVGMSSGISGTIQVAHIAAEELEKEFSERTVRVVDSLGAGFGPGLLACLAADLRNEGKNVLQAAKTLKDETMHLLQLFTVDDLNFLKRSGRIGSATAAIGTMLNIKPLLWGDPTGHVVELGKCRGWKKSIETIAEMYRKHAVDAQNRRVAISHGDCPEIAQLLADKINSICKPKELILCPHEPFTGAHVGPGMLALFFFGKHRNELQFAK